MDVKDQIISAARKVFKSWGLKKSTMEDIAREAGKGKATLYYYFKSKEDVFHSVVEQELLELHTSTKNAVDSVQTATEKIMIYFQTNFAEVRKRTTIYNLIKMEIKENPKLLLDLRQTYDNMELNIIKSILRSGIQSNEFVHQNEENLDFLSFVIASAQRSILLDLFIERDFYGQPQQIESIASILVKGLKQ